MSLSMEIWLRHLRDISCRLGNSLVEEGKNHIFSIFHSEAHHVIYIYSPQNFSVYKIQCLEFCLHNICRTSTEVSLKKQHCYVTLFLAITIYWLELLGWCIISIWARFIVSLLQFPPHKINAILIPQKIIYYPASHTKFNIRFFYKLLTISFLTELWIKCDYLLTFFIIQTYFYPCIGTYFVMSFI